MPPEASTVCASSCGRFPTMRTWAPAWVTAIAARQPAAPVPMTRTLVVVVRCVTFRAIDTLGGLCRPSGRAGKHALPVPSPAGPGAPDSRLGRGLHLTARSAPDPSRDGCWVDSVRPTLAGFVD